MSKAEKVILNGYENGYEFAGNLIGLWIHAGEKLLKSSTFLIKNDFNNLTLKEKKLIREENIDNHSFGDIPKMLEAMALECFFKAILVKSGKIIIDNNKMSSNGGKYNNHKLIEMAIDSSIRFNKNEIELLNYLSGRIMLSRFPIPKKNFLEFGDIKTRNKEEDSLNFIKILNKISKKLN